MEGELAEGGLGAQMILNLEGRGKVLGLGHGQGPEVTGPATLGQAWGNDSKQLHTVGC